MKSMATALSAPLTPSSSSTVADAQLGYQQGFASSAGKIRCCEETTDVRGVRMLVAQNHSYLPSPVSPANREKKESRRADSNRLPLLQLRVMHQALQRFAQACKSRISKGFSFLCFAPFCTVLRSRWCQSGVIIRPRNTEAVVSRQPLYARTCSVSCGYSGISPRSPGDRHPTVATPNGAPTILSSVPLAPIQTQVFLAPVQKTTLAAMLPLGGCDISPTPN